MKKEPPVAGNRRDNCDNHGFGPYPPTQTGSHQGLPGTPRGSKITLLPDGPCGQAPRGLSMGPLGELPRAFCCNSAISRSLLIGIRRFLVQTWIEFQGGSNGELKMTPKPQKDPLFRGFRFFARSMAQDRHSLGLRLNQPPAK